MPNQAAPAAAHSRSDWLRLALAALALAVIAALMVSAGSPATSAAAATAAEPLAGSQFLKIEGVEGESLDKDHRGWINVISVNQTMTKSGSRADAKVRPLVLRLPLDRGGVKIAEGLTTGKVFKSATFERTTSEGAPYYQYELKNVLVTSYSINSSASRTPVQVVRLKFTEITTRYFVYDAAGQLVDTVEYTYNLAG